MGQIVEVGLVLEMLPVIMRRLVALQAMGDVEVSDRARRRVLRAARNLSARIRDVETEVGDGQRVE